MAPSLAAGLAQQWQRLVLVTGDLALLHDANGWLWRRRLTAELRVVLIDNAGGGVFEQLPIHLGSPMVSIASLPCPPAAMPWPSLLPRLLRDCSAMESVADDLQWLLEPGDAIRLLRCSTDRARDAQLRQQLRDKPWWEQTPSP